MVWGAIAKPGWHAFAAPHGWHGPSRLVGRESMARPPTQQDAPRRHIRRASRRTDVGKAQAPGSARSRGPGALPMDYGPAKRGVADDHIRPPATDTWLRAKEAAAYPPSRQAVVVFSYCTLRASRNRLTNRSRIFGHKC